MSRRTGPALAGALLCAAAGCLFTPPPAPTPGAAAKPGTKVVSGQVRVVAAGLFEALADAGIVVVEKRQDQQVRLVGSTPSGKMFALLLRPARSDSDKTEVAVLWGGAPDEKLTQVVRRTLEAMRPEAEEHPEETPKEKEKT
jgi:hypothetical protein